VTHTHHTLRNLRTTSFVLGEASNFSVFLLLKKGTYFLSYFLSYSAKGTGAAQVLADGVSLFH
jgi:hypothetical protein